jgi:hypothetical protein
MLTGVLARLADREIARPRQALMVLDARPWSPRATSNRVPRGQGHRLPARTSESSASPSLAAMSVFGDPRNQFSTICDRSPCDHAEMNAIGYEFGEPLLMFDSLPTHPELRPARQGSKADEMR